MPMNEQLSFSVSFGGAVKASASTNINDTSRPAYEYLLVPTNTSSTSITEIDIPTYVLSVNKTTVNEGDAVTFTLTTTMLDVNTPVPYTITGITSADLSSGGLTGNFVINADGTATVTPTLKNDLLTEGTESMTLTLNGKSISKTVTINDTSGTAAYDVGWYSDATGNNIITSVNEGESAYLVVKTANVTNGTILTYTLGGTGINIDDTTQALSGSLVINSNTGYIAISPKNDMITEGIETLVAKILVGSGVVGTSSITINDTSTAPYDGGEVIFTMAKTPTYGIPVTNTRSYSVYVGSPPYTMPSPIGTFHSDTLMLNGIAAQIDSISVYSVGAGYGDWFVYIDVRGQGNVGNVGNRNIVVTRVDNGVVLANSRLTNVGGDGVRFTSTPVGQSSEFTLPVGVKLKLTIVKV